MKYKNTKTGVVVSVFDGVEVRGDWVAIAPAPVVEQPKKTPRKRTTKTK